MDVDAPPASRPGRPTATPTATNDSKSTVAAKAAKPLVASATGSSEEGPVKRQTKKSEPKKTVNVTPPPLEAAPVAPDLQTQLSQQPAAPLVIKEANIPLLEKLAAILKKAKESKK